MIDDEERCEETGTEVRLDVTLAKWEDDKEDDRQMEVGWREEGKEM